MRSPFLLLLLVLLAPMRCLAGDVFSLPTSLRELDQKLSQFKSDPGAFIAGSLPDKVAKWTGAPESVRRVGTAGRHAYSIQDRGISVVEQMIQDPGSTQALSDRFWNDLKGDAKDMLLSLLPERVKNVYATVQQFRQNVEYYADWAQQGLVGARQVAEEASRVLTDTRQPFGPTSKSGADLDAEISDILNSSLERSASTRRVTADRAEALQNLKTGTAKIGGGSGENILALMGTLGVQALQIQSERDRRRADVPTAGGSFDPTKCPVPIKQPNGSTIVCQRTGVHQHYFAPNEHRVADW